MARRAPFAHVRRVKRDRSHAAGVPHVKMDACMHCADGGGRPANHLPTDNSHSPPVNVAVR